MRRLTAMAAMAVLAVLAAIAAAGIAGSNALAQDNGPTTESCGNAWAIADAWNTCGSRTSALGSTHESIEVIDGECAIATGCLYYIVVESFWGTNYIKQRRQTSWQGPLDDTHRLQNCDGYLQLIC